MKKHVQTFEGFVGNSNDSLTKTDLDNMSNDDIKKAFKVEDYTQMPSPIKEYIVAGKESFTMGPRSNHVEKLLMQIVVDRFLDGRLS